MDEDPGTFDINYDTPAPLIFTIAPTNTTTSTDNNTDILQAIHNVIPAAAIASVGGTQAGTPQAPPTPQSNLLSNLFNLGKSVTDVVAGKTASAQNSPPSGSSNVYIMLLIAGLVLYFVLGKK